MTRHAADIRDTADALTEPAVTRTPLYAWDAHRHKTLAGHHQIVLPGLLAQLHQSVYPSASSAADGGYAGGKPGSRPPLALEALTTHRRIIIGTIEWCLSVGLTIRPNPESNLRQLAAKAQSFDDHTAAKLLTDLRRWHRWCLVMTGWEHLRAIREVPCPDCNTPGRLRLNLTNGTAICHHCGTGWDGPAIHTLAAHCANHRVSA